jgi:hypothetical protein
MSIQNPASVHSTQGGRVRHGTRMIVLKPSSRQSSIKSEWNNEVPIVGCRTTNRRLSDI